MRQLIAALFSTSLATIAVAQTALVREGDPYPGGPANQVYSSFNVGAVATDLGYACTFTAAGPGGFVQGIWGDLDGGPGGILRSETTIGSLTQTAIESFFGINGSQIAYSSNVDDAAGSTGLDSVWVDDHLIALDGQLAAGTAEFLNFVSRPGITASGVPYYAAGLSAVSGGSSTGRCLYLGTTLVYRDGDLIPGAPAPISAQGIDFDFRFSSEATHHITPLGLNLPITEDAIMALDGAGLVLGGSLVQEGQLVPPPLGGPPEAWERFDFCGITETGNYMFTGDTNGLATEDEFIVRNGGFWAREGDTLDGEQLTGDLRSASLSEANQIAFVWAVTDPTAGSLQALYVESTLLLKEGDPVDWDGDGTVDLNTAIVNFTGINPIAINPAGLLYFTADVNVSGTVLEGFFSIATTSFGNSYCSVNPNSTGSPASIRALGSSTVAGGSLFLRATSLPAHSFGFFIVSRLQGFAANPGGSEGNLCLGGPVGRFQNQVQSSGAAGTVAIHPDLSALPQPLGPVSAQPGETWNFSTWFRDQASGGAPTSNFSDGVEVTFL